jgi:hypothetical protein
MQRHLQNLLLTQFLRLALPLLLAGSSASLNACTLWAAAGEDASGGTIISKNRDWKPDHTQVLKLHRDRKGYAYFGLYAEGNNDPGLKEGVNERGLTVVSATVGAVPKATREAESGKGKLSGALLAGYASCDEVLADQKKLFANRRPTFLMMADRRKILMLEVGLRGRYDVKVIESGAYAHSNHYLEPSLAEFNLRIGTSSAARLVRISHLLATSPKPFDTASFAAMSKDQHDGPDNSLWRTGQGSRTLSSWIVETAAQGAPKLRVVMENPGKPEQTQTFILDEQFWETMKAATAPRRTASSKAP